MRSISASTSAISFNAAGDSVVLDCWTCDVAMAPLTRIMMDAAAVHAFIPRNLAVEPDSPNKPRTGVDGSDFLDWPEAYVAGGHAAPPSAASNSRRPM